MKKFSSLAFSGLAVLLFSDNVMVWVKGSTLFMPLEHADQWTLLQKPKLQLERITKVAPPL